MVQRCQFIVVMKSLDDVFEILSSLSLRLLINDFHNSIFRGPTYRNSAVSEDGPLKSKKLNID